MINEFKIPKLHMKKVIKIKPIRQVNHITAERHNKVKGLFCTCCNRHASFTLKIRNPRISISDMSSNMLPFCSRCLRDLEKVSNNIHKAPRVNYAFHSKEIIECDVCKSNQVVVFNKLLKKYYCGYCLSNTLWKEYSKDYLFNKDESEICHHCNQFNLNSKRYAKYSFNNWSNDFVSQRGELTKMCGSCLKKHIVSDHLQDFIFLEGHQHLATAFYECGRFGYEVKDEEEKN